MQTLHTPALLVIMDGFGLAEPGPGNAISLANTPYLMRFGRSPHASLKHRARLWAFLQAKWET